MASKSTVAPDDNPAWTRRDFERAIPEDAWPEAVRAAFPRTRGPQKAPRKVAVSLRLSPDVVAHYRATGPGWQARMDEALRKAAGL